MSMQWSVLKNIIHTHELQEDIFLSLIDEEGNIMSANANMVKTLHLKNAKKPGNFFQLLHPDYVDAFKEAIRNAKQQISPVATELYLKNGYYHSMKWQVNFIDDKKGINQQNYLCIGYKLLDDERLKQFNQLGEKNYHLIMEGLNAGILFQDMNGEIIAANKKVAEVFSSTLERLYQLHNIKDLWNNNWGITSEYGDPVCFENTPFMKALQTGKMHSEVLVVQLRYKEKRWVLFNSQPLFETGSKTPFSVVTNIVDVTKEYQLTDEVKRRDTLFRAFLNYTPNLAWALDDNGTLLFASSSFYRFFRVDEKNAVHRNVFDVVPQVVIDALHEKHIRVLKTGKPIESIEKTKWADGTEFHFHINIFPVESESGRKIIGGHAINLSDKYAVEKKLREANERLLLLSRTTSDAIWEWDMQTGYIFRNDVLMDMIGYQTENSKGLSWWLRRIHPEDRDRLAETIKEATDKGLHSWSEEYRFKCADGSYKKVGDRGFVIYDNGLPVKMIGSIQDITELRDLKNLLTEEKLQKQREISETAIKVQENERTRIGHELHDNVNQILSTVKLFMDKLKPATDEEKMIKSKIIEYQLEAIEEIRKLSKELVAPQLKGKDLVDSIQQLIDDIHLSVSVQIKFIHDHDSNLLSHGKKVTIFRIVQEQLKNILKYSQAKQVNIFLQCRNNKTELVMEDDGIGFDLAQIKKGIGISNIHDRARFYNGIVNIETSPGNGCALHVIIPMGD